MNDGGGGFVSSVHPLGECVQAHPIIRRGARFRMPPAIFEMAELTQVNDDRSLNQSIIIAADLTVWEMKTNR